MSPSWLRARVCTNVAGYIFLLSYNFLYLLKPLCSKHCEVESMIPVYFIFLFSILFALVSSIFFFVCFFLLCFCFSLEHLIYTVYLKINKIKQQSLVVSLKKLSSLTCIYTCPVGSILYTKHYASFLISNPLTCIDHKFLDLAPEC